ncbi:MAG: imidazole glycerol phosphate synthase subunit HisH [Candidatus Bathyarchaeia archaeon]
MVRAVIVDYGVGNLFSIRSSLTKAGFDASISSDPMYLRSADAIILPGVGSFTAGSKNIQGIKDTLLDAIERCTPLLGICLGMQLFFEESEEGPGRGLGILSGKVVGLPKGVKSPHMGWNNLRIVRYTELLEGISEKDYFYFVHSYYVKPYDRGIIIAETGYGVDFTSVIARGSIFGVQFHPEKSDGPGMHVIRNFMKITRR